MRMQMQPGEIKGAVYKLTGDELMVRWNGTVVSHMQWLDDPMPGNMSMRTVEIILDLIAVARKVGGACEFEFIQPNP